MAKVESILAVVFDCPVHGKVEAEYNPECFWWECPQMVECGRTVTKEDLARSEDEPTV